MFDAVNRSEPVIAAPLFEVVAPERLQRYKGRNKIDPKEEIRREAEAARAQAQEDGFALGKQQGYEEGHAEGLELGRAEAFAQHQMELRQELADMRLEWEQVLNQLASAVEAFYQEAEDRLSLLAMEVVRRVLAAELEIRDDAVVAITRAAMTEVAQSRSVKVRVNPFESPLLKRYRDALLNEFSQVRALEIVDDPTITHGCVVESDHGTVDATVETSLNLLEQEAA